MLILGTLTAFGPMSIDMYLPSLPAIGQSYNADAGAVQLTLSLFFVGLALGQAFYGPLSDRYGRRAPLLVGCAIYTVASAGCMFAASIEVLTVLRFAQAIGGCAGMVIARSVVRDLYEPRESARVYSLLMLVMGLAPITAPLIGGQLLVWFDWRAIFGVLTAFGLACLALVARGLPESLPAERRVTGSMLDALGGYRRLLADRRFVGFALAGGGVYAGMFAYIAGSPFVIIELYGIAPQHYGWVFGANAFGLILASQINRGLLKRYAAEKILAAALAVVVLSGLALVGIAASGSGGLAGLLIPLFICVAGVGMVGPNALAAAMASHGGMAGSASALLGVTQYALGATASALVSALHNETAVPMAVVIAGCGIVALLSLHGLAARQPAGAVSG